MIDYGSFHRFIEPMWHCLRCDRPIGETVFDANNGTCDECENLPTIPVPVKLDMDGVK